MVTVSNDRNGEHQLSYIITRYGNNDKFLGTMDKIATNNDKPNGYKDIHRIVELVVNNNISINSNGEKYWIQRCGY